MPSFTCSSAPIRNSVMAFCFRVSSRNDLVATPIEKICSIFTFCSDSSSSTRSSYRCGLQIQIHLPQRGRRGGERHVFLRASLDCCPFVVVVAVAC